MQSRLPFTSLRFARPRGPTPGQAVVLACTVAALGVSAWAIRTAGAADAALTQARAQLAVNTRGAMAGQQAADQLASQARAEAAEVMARRDAVQAAAAQAVGFAPSRAYPQGDREDEATASGGSGTLASGMTPSTQTAYGAPSYGSPYGTRPSGPGAPPPDGNVMGYTLPSSGPPR